MLGGFKGPSRRGLVLHLGETLLDGERLRGALVLYSGACEKLLGEERAKIKAG